jgi:hypothetical protein
MKKLFKNLFTSKKKKQKAIDDSYVELDRILRQKRLEHDAALAKKAAQKPAQKPAAKKVPVKNVTVTVNKTTKTPTAKKPVPKKK